MESFLNIWASLCLHSLRTFAKLRKLSQNNLTFTLCITAAVLSGGTVPAQTAHISGVQLTLPFQGLNNPKQIASDASGNLYIADSQNNRVLKETSSASGYTQSTIGSGLNTPLGVTVDASGNVYIADSNNGRVLKETISGGSYTQSVVVNGLDTIWGVAVDASGNVFIADPNRGQVLEETPSGSSYTQSTIGTGLSYPNAVAVDANNSVYVADSQNNQVFKETPSGSSYTQTTIGAGFSSKPMSVAVDASGNVYVSVYGTPGDSEASEIFKETLSGGSYTQSSVGAGTYFALSPATIAVDATGDVFVATFSSLLEVKPTTSANFGTVNVATSSSTISLIFTFDSAGSIAKPAVLTQGITGLDFADAGTGTCTTLGTSFPYTAGQTCTVDVTFTPKAAGLRYGAAVLNDNSGNTIANGYAQGMGSSPQVNFLPSTQSTLSLGNLSSPSAIAQDAAGSLYITEAITAFSSQNAVVKETWAGGGYTQSTVMGGLAYPVGVAVDGAGNVYVADQDASSVFKLIPSSSGYTLSSTFSGMGNVESVAVDGSGNIYIGSLAEGLLKETPTAGGYVQSTIARTVYASGIAVDGAGNVYVSTNSGQLFEEALSGSTYTQSTIVSGLNRVIGIALDGVGNIYAADIGNGTVIKETLSGGTYTQSTIASNLTGDIGVAVDSTGNVFVSSGEANTVWKIDFSDPPSLSFASTPFGALSSDSAKAVALTNVGNAPLNFPVPSAGTNPSIFSSFTLGTSSSCPQLTTSSSTAATLAPGASCLLQVSFQPSGIGSLSGSLVLTDNNQGAVSPGYTTQTLSLEGTGTQATPSISWSTPTAISYGAALSATQLNATASVPGTFAYTPAPGSVLNPGLQTLSVTFTPTDTTDYATATATTSITVSAATPSISWSTPAAISYGTALSATQLNATASVPGTFAYTPASGTVLNAGSQTLSVTFAPADTTHYTTATATTGITVSPVTPSLSFAPIASQVYGTAAFPVSAASASAGALTYGVVSGPATISGNMVTLTGAGTVVLVANQAANGNYGAATATISFSVAAPFTFASATTTSIMATTGGAANCTFTLTPGGSVFPDAISFSATGLPAGATATFSPATVAAGSKATSVTLTIQTSSQTAQSKSLFFGSGLVSLSLGFLLLPLIGTRSIRRKMPYVTRLMMAVVSVGIVLGLGGCAGSSNPQQSHAPSPQTYTVTVLAKDVATGAQSSIPITLTVQ